ncbi:MAG: type II toxin-antitoxin system HicB family antitoxin [Candidatus Methanofastidiosia archaeon]
MKKHMVPIIVEKDENGYFVYCPVLQGCYTQGETYEEAMKNIRDAIHLHIQDILESGEELPKFEFLSLAK